MYIPDPPILEVVSLDVQSSGLVAYEVRVFGHNSQICFLQCAAWSAQSYAYDETGYPSLDVDGKLISGTFQLNMPDFGEWRISLFVYDLFEGIASEAYNVVYSKMPPETNSRSPSESDIPDPTASKSVEVTQTANPTKSMEATKSAGDPTEIFTDGHFAHKHQIRSIFGYLFLINF
jgi:hypothetical protein